jgi:hypothetical protein
MEKSLFLERIRPGCSTSQAKYVAKEVAVTVYEEGEPPLRIR